MVISISQAKYIAEYKIQFSFSDGTERIVDFGAFLADIKNPMTKKYLDKQLFKNFTVEFGDIQWNDYEMCFPIWDIHECNI